MYDIVDLALIYLIHRQHSFIRSIARIRVVSDQTRSIMPCLGMLRVRASSTFHAPGRRGFGLQKVSST